MFEVDIYNFSKRINSTKQISGGGTTIQCEMVAQSSIISPTVMVNYGLVNAPVNFNYAYIPEFKRYYFIEDWTFKDGIWYGQFNEDVLATWKNEISSQDLYIARASTTFDTNVPDTFYPSKSSPTTIVNTARSPFTTKTTSSGTFILGVMNGAQTGNNTAYGAITYYFCYAETIRELCNKLFDATLDYTEIDFDSLEELTGITSDLLKTLFNPMQYITSCLFVPLPLDIEGGESMKVGFWDSGVTGYGYNISQPYEFQHSLAVPKHPQLSRGQWLQMSPYSVYTLTIPAIGQFAIDSNDLQGENQLTIDYKLDLISGECAVQISNSRGIIKHVSAPVGVNVAIGGMAGGGDTTAMLIASGLNALGGVPEYIPKTKKTYAFLTDDSGAFKGLAYSGNTYSDDIIGKIGQNAQSVMDFATGVGNAVNTAMRNADIISSNGSFAKLFYDSVQLKGMFFLLADEDNDHNGRPLMQRASITSLGEGYYQFMDGDIEFTGTTLELNAVKNYLAGGIFYE